MNVVEWSPRTPRGGGDGKAAAEERPPGMEMLLEDGKEGGGIRETMLIRSRKNEIMLIRKKNAQIGPETQRRNRDRKEDIKAKYLRNR